MAAELLFASAAAPVVVAVGFEIALGGERILKHAARATRVLERHLSNAAVLDEGTLVSKEVG